MLPLLGWQHSRARGTSAASPRLGESRWSSSWDPRWLVTVARTASWQPPQAPSSPSRPAGQPDDSSSAWVTPTLAQSSWWNDWTSKFELERLTTSECQIEFQHHVTVTGRASSLACTAIVANSLINRTWYMKWNGVTDSVCSTQWYSVLHDAVNFEPISTFIPFLPLWLP